MGELLLAWSPFGIAGEVIEDAVKSGIDMFARQMREGASKQITDAFEFASQQGSFNLGFDGNNSLYALWPYLSWCGLVLALFLMSWQVMTSIIRRDSGVLATAVIGVVKYAFITAAIVGVVAVFSEICTALTKAILKAGANVTSMQDASKDLVGAFSKLEGAGLMLILSIVMILLALLLMIVFALMQIAVIVMVAISPIVAASVISESTASWWHKLVKMILALLLAKPVIAIVLVVVMKLLGSSDGPVQVIAAAIAMLIMVLVPIMLFKMLDSATGGWGQKVVGAAAGNVGAAAGSVMAPSAAGGGAGASEGAAKGAGIGSEAISKESEQREANARQVLDQMEHQEGASDTSRSGLGSNDAASPSAGTPPSPGVGGGPSSSPTGTPEIDVQPTGAPQRINVGADPAQPHVEVEQPESEPVITRPPGVNRPDRNEE